MAVHACSARVVLIAQTIEHGLRLRARFPEYSHTFVVATNDPSAIDKMRGRLFSGWVLAPGAEHGRDRRASELIEYARRYTCGCPQHYPDGLGL